MSKPKLEVHEHCYVTGPNAHNSVRYKFEHSHEGGDVPHVHEDSVHRTGPGCYTIDKDDWFRRTGLRGGGRKKFTSKPSGVQLPVVRVDPPKIRVVIVGDAGAAAARGCEGPGADPIHRMQLAFGAEVESVEVVP
ncbi:MAG TPA: hypothetical protein VGK73_11680 [Polyangiaceae bacterium]